MLVLFGYCERDVEQAIDLSRWLNELGGCKGHQVAVTYDKRCSEEQVKEIQSQLVKAFDDVHSFQAGALIDGWPEGANYFFRILNAYAQNRPVRYYFWLEPDAVPLQSAWLDRIEAEFKLCGRPFMGDRVEVGDIPLHMSGVGVYPNPLYDHAGEAYRAAEIAWDMAAKDQIVPRAHFTKLIEHAWKHPTFTRREELTSQIREQAVLFHSSKDGSLIRLLREKSGGGDTHVASSMINAKEPDKPGSPPPLSFVESLEPIGQADAFRKATSPGPIDAIIKSLGLTDKYPPPQPVTDIFIRTYPGDYEWLYWCIRSIDKFATGFKKLWIVSPQAAPDWMKPRMGKLHSGTPIEWKVMNEEADDHYLSQQIHKLYADAITNYEADYILHIDSDVVLTQPITPGSFIESDGAVVWPFTPYSATETPWQPITEKFLKEKVENEFMRRLPIMVPKWLYGNLRNYCWSTHNLQLGHYIRQQPEKSFSEFNALGAFAYQYHRGQFAWVNTVTNELPAPFARQYHSWSGLSPEIKAEIETTLGGDAPCSEERKPNSAKSDAAPTVQPAGAAIKKLPNDIWVLEREQISGWVEETGKLDHDGFLIPFVVSQFNEGETVIDVGAFIGDHTVAYARKAGMVHAFEPNPVAFECLAHNVPDHVVTLYPVALGNKQEPVPISTREDGEVSGAFVGDEKQIFRVMMRRLDEYPEIAPDLIKIDVEGYELEVLKGAERMINEHRPKIVLEIQRDGLARQGTSPDEIFGWLTQHLYGWRIIEPNHLRDAPLYNIICLPAVDKPGRAKVKAHTETPTPERIDAGASVSTPSPQAPLTPYGEMKAAIALLKRFAETNTGQRLSVMQTLRHSGLTTKWPRKKKKK